MLPNSEWILLAILAVILLKPEDIPTVARFLAKAIRQVQQFLKHIDLLELEKHLENSTPDASPKKYPFHVAPPKAKSQPVKD